MFRTILVHHQEQHYKLYIAFSIRRYHTSVCCVAIATQQTDVPAYTGIYQMRCTVHKVAPDDGLIQPETCRASNKKVKCNHKNFVHLVGLYTCTYMQI